MHTAAVRSSARRLVAVVGVLALALLGGAAVPVPAAARPASSGGSFTATCSDGYQQWTVPANVYRVLAEAAGGQGWPVKDTNGGGSGGVTQAWVKVHPGDVLGLWPGCAPKDWYHGGTGWADGGTGSHSSVGEGDGHGGGGAAAVTQIVGKNTTLLLVAGGGGGGADTGGGNSHIITSSELGSQNPCCTGGGYGGNPPRKGYDGGPSGGEGGGGGAAPGPDGVSGEHASNGGGGGGGGGGYPHGGNGGHKGTNTDSGGGGGGGDSYANSALTYDAQFDQDVGDGFVIVSWVPSVPARVLVYGGDGGSATIGRPFAHRLAARVVDAAGNPVAGAPVTFGLPIVGGMSGTFAGARSVVVTTGKNGVATAPTLTANDIAGSWQAQATVGGRLKPAVFHMRNLPAATATGVVASGNPSQLGEPVHFTATVRATTANAGVPTGRVQFAVDGHDLGGPVPLDAHGAATSEATSDLSKGTHTVTADYLGAVSYGKSTGSLSQRVDGIATATTLTSSANSSTRGEAVTFTALVTVHAPSTAIPTGSVQFEIDGSKFGAPVPLNGGGQATSEPVSDLAQGDHWVDADYLPGASAYAPSRAALRQSVQRGATATTVTSPANPSEFGQPIRFTAHVVVDPSSSVVVDSGTVQFTVDGKPWNGGDPVPVHNGTATSLPDSRLALGAHEVRAVYSGSTQVTASRGVLTQMVGTALTATTVTSSANPSDDGELVRFTATVHGQGSVASPTGTVQFQVDGHDLGTPVALSDGQATSPPVRDLAVGLREVRADYRPDSSDFRSSWGTMTQRVGPATTATTVTASANPAVFGEQVSFTATVRVHGLPGVAPPGSVQFRLDGKDLGEPVTLSGGRAVSPPVPRLAVGTHTVLAEYQPTDVDFEESLGELAEQTVQARTTLTLRATADPSHYGQRIAITAHLAVLPPGAGTPTGTIQFKLNGENFGNAVPIRDGAANAPLRGTLLAGTYHWVATYSGDDSFRASTRGLLGIVTPASSTVTPHVTPDPSDPGRPVRVTATISDPPGTAAPTGTVQFILDGADLGGPVTVHGGQATAPALTGLDPGAHGLEAAYAGDTNYEHSSAVATLTVRDATQTVVSSSDDHVAPGQQVTFYASVFPTHTDGTISFAADGTPLPGCQRVDAGDSTAACTTAALDPGEHTITAHFDGSHDYRPSRDTAALTVDDGHSLADTGVPLRALLVLAGLVLAAGAAATLAGRSRRATNTS